MNYKRQWKRQSARDTIGLAPAPSLREWKPGTMTSPLELTEMTDLDLMIAQGYGDTPQCDLPADWRVRRNSGPKPERRERRA
jgi:hypothetical protein